MLSERSYQVREIKPPFPLLMLVALAALTLLLLRLRARHAWALWTWLWFLFALAPVNGFLPTGNILWSDKYTYVPHMGLMLGFSIFLDRLLPERRRHLAMTGIVLCLCAVGTLLYAGQWRSNEFYFDSVMRNGGPVGYSRLMIAMSRRSRGDLDGAVRALEDKGLLREAAGDYETALRIDPRFLDALLNLGLLYSRMGETEKGARLLAEALRAERGGGAPGDR
jgi:tetratricopeptide (TPR) repeat protein